MSKTSQSELKKLAGHYLNLRELFPKSRVNTRTKLNEYQQKKIRHALREIENIAASGDNAILRPWREVKEIAKTGLMGRDFVPLKNSKKYMQDNKLPSFMKGVFMTGGDRDNHHAEYVDGLIRYQRGGTTREFINLNNWSSRALLADLKDQTAKYDTKHGVLHLTANGRVIVNSETHDKKAIEMQAVMVHDKYRGMARRGEKRANGRLAADPKKWGIGLLWEKAKPMTAARAWSKLSDAEKAVWAEGAKYFNTSKFEAFKIVFEHQ